MACYIIPDEGTGGVEVAARAAASGGLIELVTLVNLGCPFVRDFRAAIIAAKHGVAIFSLWKSCAALIIARLLHPRARLVAFLHADHRAHAVDGLATWLMCRFASEVWADCPQTITRRRFAVGRKKARAISFMLDRMPAAPAKVPGPRFVYWGRLDPLKRLDKAIETVAAMRRMGIAAELDLYGPDSGDGRRLREIVLTSGLAGCVRFHGEIPREDLPKAAAGRSFFILPSKQEGACIAVLEALQLGLVPIVTPVGGMVRYIRFGHSFSGAEDAAKWAADLIDDPGRYWGLRGSAMAYAASLPLYSDEMRAALAA